MFDGVPDQFHRFIASSIPAATTLPLPLSFPPRLHHVSNSSPFPPPFDPLYTSTTSNTHPFFLHQKIAQEKEDNTLMGVNIERQRSIDHHHPWSNEEVLALLRVRSSMENWFPEFTWDHVSRKLAELGFKRSAEKCKEKFEEESRYFNSNINCSKNLRIFSELEELCHGEQNNPQPRPPAAELEKNKSLENHGDEEECREDDSRNDNYGQDHNHQTEGNSLDGCNEKVVDGGDDDGQQKAKSRKRKREKKFEIFKGFCEDVVNKLMQQQEELHNKLLEDMVRRDEEKVAREEAWKKQETDRINKELELRTQEQAIAGDRQATLIKILSKFAPNSGLSQNQSTSLALAQNPNFPITSNQTKVDQVVLSTSSIMSQMKPSSLTENPASQNPSSPLAPTTPKAPTSSPVSLTPQNPNSFNAPKTPKAPQNLTSISDHKEDLGKRWPRDEVLALINLRCSLFNSTSEEKEGGGALKAPLWERISQGMLELGYTRSAKRCKEKWENINKYFRKTKDNNKKRSVDSRTCPYFHQLSTLYNQGTLVAPSEGQETQPPLGNRSGLSETWEGTDSTMAQVPTFDFGF